MSSPHCIYASLICLLMLLSENFAIDHETQDKTSMQLQLFQKLFEEKRKEQKTAVEVLLRMNDYSKQYKMIELTLEKIFQVLSTSQEVLRKEGYVPGESFPENEDTQNALAQTLETTCLLGEVVLHLPTITHKVLAKLDAIHRTLLAWGVFFTAESSFLPKTTKRLVHLMTQELGLAEKDPNFVNPYAKKTEKRSEEVKAPKGKKKKSFRKGPSLSRQYGDL